MSWSLVRECVGLLVDSARAARPGVVLNSE